MASENNRLDPSDFTRQRDEANREGVRGLLIINGGGAVALLAFLQAIWPDNKLLAKYVVIGIGVLAIGVFLAVYRISSDIMLLSTFKQVIGSVGYYSGAATSVAGTYHYSFFLWE